MESYDIQKARTELSELNEKLMNANSIDSKELPALYTRQSELSEITSLFDEIEAIKVKITSTKELLNSGDKDFAEMANLELTELEEKFDSKQKEYNLLLIPADPNDSKNAIVEIRAGTGGEEASLFAGDLFRMYNRFASLKKWDVQLMSVSESDTSGIKEAIFKVNGKNAYRFLKNESGVHRVQRVPSTESSGRIHTSAASVVVMPEIDDISVVINQNDLRIDVYRSGGNGGQSVNTTDSAVRITHIPSGIVVTCQDTKDQIKNKASAMSVLKSKLYQVELDKQQGSISDTRKSSIKTGDRSDKIKTYNFPQDRLTDHRIKKSWHGLNKFLSGEIEELLNTTAAMISGGEVGNESE
jgi:peptide chain release factor 1